MYKINLHAHTIFSDGANSPLGMAIEAKRLGFTALVITDHYYGPSPECTNWTIDTRKMKLLRGACVEAKEVLPVIVGIELSFGKEEILTFGSAMVQAIMRHRENGHDLTMELLLKWKRRFDCAFVLCHPCDPENWKALRPILDGYERYNSGQDMFPDRGLGPLEGLPGWCNSDAHCAESLSMAHNIVDAKIETEVDLIKYIKRRRQPEHYVDSDYQQ